MTKTSWAALAALGLCTLDAQRAHADPCGMVPPMQMVDRTGVAAIERVGAQKTFVMHRKGVETMVLRPGFKGKIDNFGMLIPFPSVPAIRKVDDNIFPHVAAAIDPPEIVAYVRRYRGSRGPAPSVSGGSGGASTDAGGDRLSFNHVRVVKQEAVGMYEVAVLAAGSAKALERWMVRHGFKYPKGMDRVVNEYVASRWVFVAVKTKVGQKAGVNPRPNMRKVNSKLPAGSTFTGNVQAMGFRFKTPRLVVPMRLSAFNKGKLRNIVYVLSDGPRRIAQIPSRYVVRQISGPKLYRNVTSLLPLRVVGGTHNQLNEWQKRSIAKRRNPEPFNGQAKRMFGADLFAISKGRLSNPDEEQEKRLLAIGEELGLRGQDIDALHNKLLAKTRGNGTKTALHLLKGMTLSVIDGDFERDVIAKQNLRFRPYKMATFRNNRRTYDARIMGPGHKLPKGARYHGSLIDEPPRDGVPADGSSWRGAAGGIGFGAGLFVLGLLWARRRR